ncbi:unnamed protein product [Didymodactylos carnosus]|uniref:Uncharacterized protein n=1 Tax=Didymodactylos carnosus TaxID=1234261 RepID=A0A816DAE9_9BILA|nr:unnamed protein product [Didymodactylos carnosus]CAF4528950.1 unnamed protein product [Didymodactylos carnosus]
MRAPIRENQENYVVLMAIIFAVLLIRDVAPFINVIQQACHAPATGTTAPISGNSFHNVSAVNRETAPPPYDESQIKV